MWNPFQTGTDRYAKAAEAYRDQAKAILALEPEWQKLTDDELRERFQSWKGKEVEELTKHTHEIFAAVREAAHRALNMKHFEVQLMGGLSLLDQSIAEMKTGEGKTLVATLPLSLHALTGKGAHLVTVNDYLAQRDADWMRPVYEALGLTVGVVVPNMSPEEKRAAYAADITYGTNNEFGFDYLRDNMAASADSIVQGDLHYAIVDEVDSILIDEARTPLIISAPDMESTKEYQRFATVVPQLKEEADYNVDEKRKAATLTDEGINHVEEILGMDNIYAENGIKTVHHLEQALRAQTLFHRDKDYVVKNGQVIIVDEFTGRLMEGRRYSEGLHQALEAKEKVTVQQESRTLATITFQNFFRLYDHLAGMTGTAVTSAEEFEKVYNLDVVSVPTNKEITRKDQPDRIYINEQAKWRAVVKEIAERHERQQPVLVGTVAIEKSEYLSQLLTKEGVTHEVLNAKHHDREAEIVANAGQAGAVTISTNMAGRGTDIKLGEGVADLGGLYVLGTERHEARRIDNQLRGRSGRQGDPGETRFFISMEDDVMRVFGGSRLQSVMERLKVPEDEAIENRLVTRAIEGAQERVEGYYFDVRKQVLSYDDVLNRQRDAIYTLRRGILTDKTWHEPETEPEPIAEHIPELIDEYATGVVASHVPVEEGAEWNTKEIAESISALTRQSSSELVGSFEPSNPHDPEGAQDELTDKAKEMLTGAYESRKTELGEEGLPQLLQAAALRAIDVHWMEHLDTMDYLRTGIGLRGYGQRDPLVEYQKEGFELFQRLRETIKTTFLETVFRAEMVQQPTAVTGEAHHKSATAPHRIGEGITPPDSPASSPSGGQAQPSSGESSGTPIRNENKDVSRNDPCPCGSGLKYKRCGLINAPEHKE